VAIAMLVLWILVIHPAETALTLLLLVLILILAQKKLVTLYWDANTLLNMISKLLDNKTNVTPTLAMS